MEQINAEPIDKEKFGAFVADLRKEKGFTQQELAERLFVSNKAVSKWERGQSLPDIILLTPLAQLLVYTVSELLKGEQITGKTIEDCEVKDLVNKVIQLSAEERAKREKTRRFWRRAWVFCAVLVALEVGILVMKGLTAEVALDNILLVEGLNLGFGAYFCFFVKEMLPSYYDENEICSYSDGVFRMNIPGVRFNNSNWPHILNAGRSWMLAAGVLYPPICWSLQKYLPFPADLFLMLAICLGFFVPMIIAAKKYE